MKLQELAEVLGLDHSGAKRILDAAHRLAKQGLTTGRLKPGPQWKDEDYMLQRYKETIHDELNEQIMDMRRQFDASYEQSRTQYMRKPWRLD